MRSIFIFRIDKYVSMPSVIEIPVGIIPVDPPHSDILLTDFLPVTKTVYTFEPHMDMEG